MEDSAQSKLERIVKTFTFRLALVYVGLFSFSVILLFAFIYTFAMNYLQTQISDTIKLQYNYLANDYKEAGSEAVEARIKNFIDKDEEGTSIYLLVNREFEKIEGNLNEWPDNAVKDTTFEKEGQWAHFYIEGGNNNPQGIEVRAILVPLSKWRWLVVGQTLQSNEKIEQTIVQAFWGSLLLTFIMAFSGAIVMTRSVMGRINVINRSAATIMHGNLSTRIPFTVGGDEFDELSSNLNQMLDRIEQLLQSLSQFANNIAHDLRSPLNRIINRLDAGLRSIDDAAAKKLMDKNIHDMQELIGTFNSILKISELEANTEFRQYEPCDLKLIIEDLVDLYEPVAAEKGVTLSNTISESLPMQGERHLLTQAFANLLDNAVKFTPKGGNVSVSAELAEDRTDIIIADSGPGVPADYREKVFEKFFRLEESRNTKGNGLGLSLVGAIARIHSAQITLEDNGPGLRVRFSIPT